MVGSPAVVGTQDHHTRLSTLPSHEAGAAPVASGPATAAAMQGPTFAQGIAPVVAQTVGMHGASGSQNHQGFMTKPSSADDGVVQGTALAKSAAPAVAQTPGLPEASSCQSSQA
eukprot:2865527-Amphidinium_carterae.1